MSKQQDLTHEATGLRAVAVTSPIVVNTLNDIPDQLVRLDGTSVVGVYYGLVEPLDEVKQQALLRIRQNAEWVSSFSKMLIDLGVDTVGATKAALGPNVWRITFGQGVFMGEVDGWRQKLAFRISLSQAYVLKAYRDHRQAPLATLPEMFGIWEGEAEAGIFVIERHGVGGRRSVEEGEFPDALKLGDAGEFQDALLERFRLTFPHVKEEFVASFTFCDEAALKKRFPHVDLYRPVI